MLQLSWPFVPRVRNMSRHQWTALNRVRLWTLHPKYLDSRGLVALWREALLAKAVLSERTRGYKYHPQLLRFRSHPQPRRAINFYLAQVLAEAVARGYSFDLKKVGPVRRVARIPVPSGQVEFEWQHLMKKLRRRAPKSYRYGRSAGTPKCHPLFRRTTGSVAPWEIITSRPSTRAGKRA